MPFRNERPNGPNAAGAGGLPHIPPLDNFNVEPPSTALQQQQQGRNRGEPLPEMNIRDRWPSATQSPVRAADTLAKPAFTPPQRTSSGGGNVTASPSSLRVQSPRLPPLPVTNDESAADALMSLQRKRSLSSDESARKRLSSDQPMSNSE